MGQRTAFVRRTSHARLTEGNCGEFVQMSVRLVSDRRRCRKSAGKRASPSDREPADGQV